MKVIAWLSNSPFAEYGWLDGLGKTSNNEVEANVMRPLRAERKASGWDEFASSGMFKVYYLGEQSVRQFTQARSTSPERIVHIVGGLTGIMKKTLDTILKTKKPADVVIVVSERPRVYTTGNDTPLRRLFVPPKYAYLVRRYRRKVDLLLPLGKSGVDSFAKLGWPKDKLFPFLYSPPEIEMSSSIDHSQSSPNTNITYVGRMDSIKGVDTLLSWLQRTTLDIHVTMVGGHGNLVDTVSSVAATDPRLTYVGVASYPDASEHIMRSDLIALPSRYDGWNMVVNEAIRLGKPVVCTSNMGSDELVLTSGAGAVVPSQAVSAFEAALDASVRDPEILERWGRSAAKYAHRISNATIGAYLRDIITYTTSVDPQDRPAAPWL